MKPLALEINNLTVAYNTTPVLWNVSVHIPKGILLAIVGPNGAGKTTLIRTILGFIKPVAGTLKIFEEHYLKQRKNIAYMPQRTSVDWDFPTTVLDVVLMGRYGFLGWIRRPKNKDYILAHEAIHQVNLSSYSDCPIGELSGGQQQRVFLARALVQNAPLFLMDEPLNGIDVATEKLIIKQLKNLKAQGKTIIVVHHDLQTLQEYFDWALMLNVKKIACGPIKNVLNSSLIKTTYGSPPTLY